MTRWTDEDLQRYRLRGARAVHTVPSGKRLNKYGNRKVTDAQGAVHDSTKEYRRWCDLELRERAGEISRLRRQLPVACVVNDVLVCHWIADFVYCEGAATIYEDCKSPPTRAKPDYRLKRKLVAAIHGIEIREV